MTTAGIRETRGSTGSTMHPLFFVRDLTQRFHPLAYTLHGLVLTVLLIRLALFWHPNCKYSLGSLFRRVYAPKPERNGRKPDSPVLCLLAGAGQAALSLGEPDSITHVCIEYRRSAGGNEQPRLTPVGLTMV